MAFKFFTLFFIFSFLFSPSISIPKSLDLALKTNWQATPLYLEIAEFLANENRSLFWKFVDNFEAFPPELNTEQEFFQYAKVKAELTENQEDALTYSLILRYYSPKLQLYRQLYTLILGSLDHDDRQKLSSCKSWIHYGTDVFCSTQDFLNHLKTSPHSNIELYDFDHKYNFCTSKDNIAILYSTLGTQDFQAFHSVLKKQADEDKICYILRHLVPSSETTMNLAGYGVELAIKSLEYKAQDDSKTEGKNATTEEVTEKAEEDGKEEEAVRGIFFNTLQKRYPEYASELVNFKSSLLASEIQFEDLKVWDLKELGYQASQRILSASQPLKLMREISQNFPTLAPSLTKVKLSETFKSELQEGLGFEPGKSLVLVNGRMVEPETINPFKLFSILNEESKKLSSILKLNIGKSDALKALSLISDSSTEEHFQIISPSIDFFNNLETDNDYKRLGFSSSVHDFVRRGFGGSFIFVAKNFFNIVFVVDPSQYQDILLLSMVESLHKQRTPARLGILLFTQDYYDFCSPKGSREFKTDHLGMKVARLFKATRDQFGGYIGLMFLRFLQARFKNYQLTVEGIKETLRVSIGKSHGIDPEKYYEEHAESTAFDEDIKAANEFICEKGISTSHKVFINGYSCAFAHLQELYSCLVNYILTATPKLQMYVENGQITDSTDIYQFLMSQPDVLPRYNAYILPSEPNPLKFINLVTNSPNHLNFIKNENAQDTTSSISHFISLDLNSFDHIEFALEALNFLKEESNSHVRMAFLHNVPTLDAPNLLPRSVIATSSQSPSKRLGFLLNLFETAFQQKQIPSEHEIYQLANQSGFNMNQFKSKFSESARSIFAEHRIFTSEFIALKDFTWKGIITNGRIFALPPEELFHSSDWRFLSKFELKSRAKKVVEFIDQITFENISSDAQTSDFLSDRVMAIHSIIGLDEQNGVKKFELFPNVKISFTATSENLVSEDFLITAIINPLSVAAQRFTPILETLLGVFDIKLQVILNPYYELSDLPLKSFYTYVLGSKLEFDSEGRLIGPTASFRHLPVQRLLTLNLDAPDSWLVSPTVARFDLDNIRFQDLIGETDFFVQFELQHILVEGNCYEFFGGMPNPPRGLELVLGTFLQPILQDTMVMSNFGYFQLKANPGVWTLQLKENSKSSKIYDIVYGDQEDPHVIVSDFEGTFKSLLVKKKPGKESEHLLIDSEEDKVQQKPEEGLWESIAGKFFSTESYSQNNTIHIFSLASGHLYERFLKIMMLSVIKNTKSHVKFWLLGNFLSPKFKDFVPFMAEKYGFDYQFVTYKWPSWLHKQTEKQRVIWGYKILFLDVLFPLNLTKVIYVDADQVVRSDLKELWDLDLQGAPYGYTPFCEGFVSNPDTLGFRFWKGGFWLGHLRGKPYHISALYVVDLKQFRKLASGDQLRATYASLSEDPNSLSNLDQDLPNYLQHSVRIYSLPQEWLWCETWCHESIKPKAKTIDLCNNPLTKTPKLENAVRIIPEWTSFDNEIKDLEKTVYGK